MGAGSTIEWTDGLTFNPWIGCTKVGPPCDNCYAERFGARLGVRWGAHELRRRTAASTWKQPLAWNRKAQAEGRRLFVFGGSLCDVFDNQVEPAWRAEYFDLIRATPHLVWLLLTKRPGKIVALSQEAGGLPANAAIGCSVGDNEEKDRDLPKLLRAKLATRPLFAFVSIEPMLGPIYLETADGSLLDPECWGDCDCDSLYGRDPGCRRNGGDGQLHGRIDWVICGGESGPGARPLHPDWARDLRDQCAESGTPFFFKQWGEWLPWEPHSLPAWKAQDGRLLDGNLLPDFNAADLEGWTDDCLYEGDEICVHERVGKKAAGRLLDGREHSARPTIPPLQAEAA